MGVLPGTQAAALSACGRPDLVCADTTADSRGDANIAGDADACGSPAVAQVEIIRDFCGNKRRQHRSNQMQTVQSEVTP